MTLRLLKRHQSVIFSPVASSFPFPKVGSRGLVPWWGSGGNALQDEINYLSACPSVHPRPSFTQKGGRSRMYGGSKPPLWFPRLDWKSEGPGDEFPGGVWGKAPERSWVAFGCAVAVSMLAKRPKPSESV